RGEWRGGGVQVILSPAVRALPWGADSSGPPRVTDTNLRLDRRERFPDHPIVGEDKGQGREGERRWRGEASPDKRMNNPGHSGEKRRHDERLLLQRKEPSLYHTPLTPLNVV
ncbi:hypothetical protein JOQ06_020187, partial [Pogonophryne albipinna]